MSSFWIADVGDGATVGVGAGAGVGDGDGVAVAVIAVAGASALFSALRSLSVPMKVNQAATAR